MKKFFVIILSVGFASWASASTVTCAGEDADGLLITEWNYGGGPPPPPELVVAKGRIFHRHLLLEEWQRKSSESGERVLEISYDSAAKTSLVSQGPMDNHLEVTRLPVAVKRRDGKALLPDGTREIREVLTCTAITQLFP